MNKITFLGTGTSVGIPMIGCPCEVCRSNDSHDKRLRTSAFIQYLGIDFLIDIGPDFRQQALNNEITDIDAILITHPHRDHVAGYDDIRALNFLYDKKIDLYATPYTWDSIRKQFYYAFERSDYTSLPGTTYHPIDTTPIFHNGVKVEPIAVNHGTMPCMGYRLGDLAYITDASHIDPDEMKKLQDLDILVINALRHVHHPSHFTLSESLAVIKELKPKRAYLIHMSHHMGLHEVVSAQLPPHVYLAYDGLMLEFG